MFAVLHHRRATSTPIFLSQSSNHPSNHPISIIQSSIRARRIVVGRSAAAAILSNRPFVVRAHNARPRSSRIVRERAAGSRASHPRRRSPVVAPAPPFFPAPRRRTGSSAASRIASRSRGRRGVHAAAGRARRVVDIEGRPDDPRRCVAAEKNGRHPRHGWRAHDRSLAPSRRRRPKDGASAAANARVRGRRRSGSSDDPEARNKSRRPRARRLPRSKRFRPRVVRRGTGGARGRPDGRRGPRGPRVAGRQRPARIFRRRTSLPRRAGWAPRSAAPARGGIQSSVEECCPGCCPRSPARRSGRSSAGTRSREGFIEPRARFPRPRMRLPSALFGVGSVRERETGVVAACCLESPNPQLADRSSSKTEQLLESRRAPPSSSGTARRASTAHAPAPIEKQPS